VVLHAFFYKLDEAEGRNVDDRLWRILSQVNDAQLVTHWQTCNVCKQRVVDMLFEFNLKLRLKRYQVLNMSRFSLENSLFSVLQLLIVYESKHILVSQALSLRRMMVDTKRQNSIIIF
jgi:hypothetical protein